MKVYLSGPISGVNDPHSDFNKAQTEVLMWAESVSNPVVLGANLTQQGDKWISLMKKAIKMMMDCDSIYMLEGWEDSRGAIMEHFLAQELEMPIFFQKKDIINE